MKIDCDMSLSCFQLIYFYKQCIIRALTVPALRGKDYGKSKMRYPDYVETESGLQYKVTQFVVK
jgi:hypothetical protein